MQCESLSLDVVIFVCLLKACGTIGDVEMGNKVHNEINNMGLLEQKYCAWKLFGGYVCVM